MAAAVAVAAAAAVAAAIRGGKNVIYNLCREKMSNGLCRF